MKIAEKAGLMRQAADRLKGVLHFLFPDIPSDHEAGIHIATNMVANVLGLGWAATPAGLAAMKEMKKLSTKKDEATDAMCDFMILNISSLQLIPVNIIAYRSQYGSVNPTNIIGPAILATTISSMAAIVFVKLRRIGRRWIS